MKPNKSCRLPAIGTVWCIRGVRSAVVGLTKTHTDVINLGNEIVVTVVGYAGIDNYVVVLVDGRTVDLIPQWWESCICSHETTKIA